MASSLALESLTSSTTSNMSPDFEVFRESTESSISNDGIIFSLLEEWQGDEHGDDEQLNDVIRSLEAEINVDTVDDDGSDLIAELEFIDGSSSLEDDEEARRTGNGDDLGTMSSNFSWAELDTVPSSPSDDMNWFMDRYEEEMMETNDAVEFGVISDYSQICCGVVLEDQGQYCSSCLWQETYEDMIYN